MKSQERQLKESFFNPIYQLFPLLVFLIIDHIFAREYAWYGAAITAVILTIYVSAVYPRLFKWYMFYMFLFLAITALMGVSGNFAKTEKYLALIDEAVLFVALLFVRLFRKQLTTLSDKLVSPFVPMSNNILELYRNIKTSTIFVFSYLVFYVAIILANYTFYRYIEIDVLNYIFAGAWIFLIVFSYLKTRFVRFHLTDERWLPIVTREGKVVGKIQRLSSLSDRRRYMHPIVRGILIKDGQILMQKPVEGDVFYKPLWDNMIDNHIGIGEKTESCLKKTALKRFGIEKVKSFCLTEYIHATPYEYQYVFVFIIADYSSEIIPNPKRIAQMKWWTFTEIEENLNAGIFDERFIKEYDLLKRSGLLDSDVNYVNQDF